LLVLVLVLVPVLVLVLAPVLALVLVLVLVPVLVLALVLVRVRVRVRVLGPGRSVFGGRATCASPFQRSSRCPRANRSMRLHNPQRRLSQR
jgi:hypothetical protein